MHPVAGFAATASGAAIGSRDESMATTIGSDERRKTDPPLVSAQVAEQGP